MPVSSEAASMRAEKSKKVLAITRGVAIVTAVTTFFIVTIVLLTILRSQEETADRILDCTIPKGACYQDKVNDARTLEIIRINAASILCATKHPAQTTDEMVACVIKEIGIENEEHLRNYTKP